MKQPSEKAASPARRRAWNTAVYVALVAAGVVAAWRVNLWWRGGEQPAAPLPREAARPDEGPDLPDEAGLADWVKHWDRHENLPGPPGGIAPPPRATRPRQFRVAGRHQTVEVGDYLYPGPAEEAADYYEQALARSGFRKISRQADGDRLRLLFVQGDTHATVSLRTRGQNPKIVWIGVYISCPSY